MKNIQLLKPQPSPKGTRNPLTNITNCFHSIPKQDKQYYRSPSLSSRNTQKRKGLQLPKHYQTAELRNDSTPKCINHRGKEGRFRIQFDAHPYTYCEDCAFELSHRGSKLVPLKNPEGSKMIFEAKQYVRVCEQVLTALNQRLGNIQKERSLTDTRFAKLKADIQEERQQVLQKINQQYQLEISQHRQNWITAVSVIEQEENKLRQMVREIDTVKEDVKINIKEMDGAIKMNEFREIMDIYWNKINVFKGLEKPLDSYTQSKSSRNVTVNDCAIINSVTKSFEEPALSNRQAKKSARDANIGKKVWMLQKARGAHSWVQSGDSGESVVEQRIKLR